MKKLLPVSLVLASVFLVSCGQKNIDNIIVTPDTPIENKDQSAKVCEPVIKYITCSIEKAPEAGKGQLQNALKAMQRKINNDEPSKVAQECDSMIKALVAKAKVAFKNGCFIEPAYAIKAPETTAAQIAPKTEAPKK
ncbi:MAG: hypothetical protein WCK88_07660 [bacterium]